MEKRVSVAISDGVADVRLVRADKMNALDAAMFDALVAATERLAHEKGVRAVVLSGEGRAFCAGLDMGRFAVMKESGGNGIAGGEKRDLSVRTHGLANYPQQAVWGWRQLEVPVIAAIQGVAFGGGFQLALGADMRFLSPDARMSIMEIKWGLVPDMAGTPILARLVRDDILRELTYTGRIFSAQEALGYGLATRIFDFFFNDTATTEIYTLSLHDALPRPRSHPGHLERPPLPIVPAGADGAAGDRKSTRLNSSHPSISYAVFCLKKKKKKSKKQSENNRKTKNTTKK